MPAPIHTLVAAPIPAPISFLESPALLSSYLMPVLTAFAALFLSHYTPVSCRETLALLLPLFVLSPPLFLGFWLFKTFKQSLWDKLWSHVSTSSIKPLYLFSTLGTYNLDNNNSLYNPINNNKRKRGFNTLFINSCLLANNHNQKEINLSFVDCGCLDIVKLN